MDRNRLPLADLIASDPRTKIIEDQRERFGYVLVRCPNDDGTDDHALHVCNPRGDLPAHAYCLSDECKDVTTEEFVELLGVSVERGRQWAQLGRNTVDSESDRLFNHRCTLQL